MIFLKSLIKSSLRVAKVISPKRLSFLILQWAAVNLAWKEIKTKSERT
jgi:hypothetical protein